MFKLLHSKIVFNAYILMILFTLLIFDGNRSNYLFLAIQSLNVLLCLLFISERPGLNLFTSFYGFSMMILGLFPIAEYKMGVIYWGGSYLSDVVYIKTSVLVLFSIVFFRFGYEQNIRTGLKKIRKNLNPAVSELQNKLTFKTILFLAIPSYYLLISFNFDILAMQFRGMSEAIETVFLFEWFFVKPLIFNICFFYLLIVGDRVDKDWILKIIFFIILLFFVNPLSVARFLAFCLFVPLFYLLKKYRLGDSYLFINIVFFGLVFIFPVLDIFRWFTLEESFNGTVNFNFDYFFAGHFDAFQNFARVIDLEIHTYGEQILGAIFFFVPRSLWASKPEGSGFLLAEQAQLYFNNISMPFVAELYLDFWLFGLFVGMAILGVIYRKIDDYMATVKVMSNLSSVAKMMAYTEFCCLQFYLLRGNLLGAFAFSCTILLTVLVVYIYYLIVNIFLKKSTYGIEP
jgi:hypothetical protein